MDTIKELFDAVFRKPLSVWSAALLLALLNILLFAYEKPWTSSDGFRNWGDWLFQTTGLYSQPQLLPSWLYSGSVLNIGLLAGALASALLSRQFALQIAPPGELVKGFIATGRARGRHPGIHGSEKYRFAFCSRTLENFGEL